MTNNKEEPNLQVAMRIYRSTTKMVTHYSTIRYMVVSFFLILSMVSARSSFDSSLNNQNCIKMLYFIGAFVFLLIAALGNKIFTKFTQEYSGFIMQFEREKEKEVEEAIFKKPEKRRQALRRRWDITGKYFKIFNLAIWTILFGYLLVGLVVGGLSTFGKLYGFNCSWIIMVFVGVLILWFLCIFIWGIVEEVS